MSSHAPREIKITEELEAMESRLANAEKQLLFCRSEMLRWPDGHWKQKMHGQDCVNWHRQIQFLERMIDLKRGIYRE